MQNTFCKDKKVSLPQTNVSLPGGLPSTNSEPRVPPLPSGLVAAPAARDHTITSPPYHVRSPGKKNSRGGVKPNGARLRTPIDQLQCDENPAEHHQEESVRSTHNMLPLDNPGKLERMVVTESVLVEVGEEMSKKLKECVIELERIDQELLELGPFAKDMDNDTSSPHRNEFNSILSLPQVPPLISPPELLGGVQQQYSPLKRSRKVNRPIMNSKVVGKRRSDDGCVSSPISTSTLKLTEGSVRSHLISDKLSGKEDDVGEIQQPRKGKWRKVGSAGSPAIPHSLKMVSNTNSHSSLGRSNNSSPVSDSLRTQPPVSTTSTKVPKSQVCGSVGESLDTDVSSPSMIPPASEIEMLSLYMPNSPWETMGSSPLHPDDSTTAMQAVKVSGSTTEKAVPYYHAATSEIMESRSDLGAQGSLQTGSRNEKIRGDNEKYYQKIHSSPPALVAAATNSHSTKILLSPLATSVKSHSPASLVAIRSECKTAEQQAPSSLDVLSVTPQILPQKLPQSNELRRHVVVQDGMPTGVFSSSLKSVSSVTQFTAASLQDPQHQHYQNVALPQGVGQHHSTTPVERISQTDLSTVSQGMHLPQQFASIDGSSGKHRRSSSSSSLQSIKQHQRHNSFDKGITASTQPSPLPTRIGAPRQTSSPLAQQALQQMQLLGGPLGDFNPLNNALGAVDSASKLAMMNTVGGVSWLPNSTAAAAIAASQRLGQPGFLGPQTSIPAASVMNAAGLPCYITNPFLTGNNWLQNTGMLAPTGLPHQLQPPVYSIDPYKQVLNSTLIPYRYPLAQPLKGFSSTSSQVFQPPSALSATNLNQTVAGTSPHGAMYPVGPNMNSSAFHSVGPEPGGSKPGVNRTPSQSNSATPPMLCLPPTQTQGFPGMLPAHVLTGSNAENNGSNNNSKLAEASAAPQTVNWIPNPAALRGSAASFNMMPYFMSQAQLGIAGPPGSQAPVNAFNQPRLAAGVPQPPFHSSDGSLPKVGGAMGVTDATASMKDHAPVFPLHKPQPQRRGSSASVEQARGECTPSNTPPLGVNAGAGIGAPSGGAKLVQFPNMMSRDGMGMWKSVGETTQNPQTVNHPYDYQNLETNPSTTSSFSLTPPMHVITPSGQLMQAGFPGMPVAHQHSHLMSKGKSEIGIGQGGRGSPRDAHNDKPKLRMHHVHNEDFKLSVKPDRRRKRWRGKNKDFFFPTRAEMAETALRNMEKLAEPPITSASSFPDSMAVEPGLSKVGAQVPLPEMRTTQGNVSDLSMPHPPAITGSKDSNYALNMLADMSSIQSSKEKYETKVQSDISNEKHSDREDDDCVAEVTPNFSPSDSSSKHSLRSPVSLAVKSLLMLGEDVRQPHVDRSRPHDVTLVEDTAVSSLLQLSSGAVLSLSKECDSKPSCASQNEVNEMGDAEEVSVHSASFSAAEAMIMMGFGNKSSRNTSGSCKEVLQVQCHSPSKSMDMAKNPTPDSFEQQVGSNPGSARSNRLRTTSSDSEVTDTDSEATLTPSPNSMIDNTSLTQLDNEVDSDCEFQKNVSPSGNNMVPNSEPNVECVVHHHEDLTCTTKGDHSSTECAGVHSIGRNYNARSKANANLVHSQDTDSSDIHSPAILKSLEEPKQDESVLCDSTPAKRPKFISTFGPVSEDSLPSLPMEIDGRADDFKDGIGCGDVSDAILVSQTDESLGRTDKVNIVNAGGLKEKSSSINEKQPGDMKERSGMDDPNMLENDDVVWVDRKKCLPVSHESGSVASVSASVQNVNVLEEEDTSGDESDAAENCEEGRNVSILDLENKSQSASARKVKSPVVDGTVHKSKIILEKEKRKRRIITIKRSSSKGLSSAGSKSRSLPSWTAFADTVDQNSSDSDDEGEHMRMRTGNDAVDDEPQLNSKRSRFSSREIHGETVTMPEIHNTTSSSHSDNMENSSGDIMQVDTTATTMTYPMRSGISKQDHKQVTKWSKEDESELQMEPKDLFDVDKAHHSEIRARRKEKRAKASQQLSSNYSHLQQKTSVCDQGLEHPEKHVDSPSTQTRDEARSSTVTDSSTALNATDESRISNEKSPSHTSHTLELDYGTFDQAFSPLSDDGEKTTPTFSSISSKPSVPRDSSSRLSDVGEWEWKWQGHHGQVNSAVPLVSSPSSSTTSSASAKKHQSHRDRHHKRHHHRVENSANTSRGSTPTKHHRHHHHSSHYHRGHHSHDERSIDDTSRKYSHEVTPKEVEFPLGKGHLSDGRLVDGRSRKRMQVDSDDDEKPLPDGGDSVSVTSCKRKVKKHREHKESHKESGKHKHGGHKH